MVVDQLVAQFAYNYLVVYLCM